MVHALLVVLHMHHWIGIELVHGLLRHEVRILLLISTTLLALLFRLVVSLVADLGLIFLFFFPRSLRWRFWRIFAALRFN
jgi:hypothetical protein